MKEKVKKTDMSKAGYKAAKTRAQNYARASAEEKVRIDEIRHLAAIKANQTRKIKKSPIRKKIKPTDWNAAVEKAENTGKAAIEITKWRISQVASKTKWQIIEFMGKNGKESVGIVDLLAIRKSHERNVKKAGLKPGDLFEIILIQTKGGNAALPTQDDIRRLRILGRYYNSKFIMLSEWKEYQLNCYILKENFEKKELHPKDVWIKIPVSEIFQ